MSKIIKYSYYTSTILALLIVTVCIIASFYATPPAIGNVYLDPDLTLSPLSAGLYFIFIIIILATLLYRLYLPFKGSIFDISKCQKFAFVVLLAVTIFWAIFSVELYFQDRDHEEDSLALLAAESPLLSIYSALFGIFYVITSSYGLFIFAQKMQGITKLQIGSFKNIKDKKNIRINADQKEILDAATKVISLLSIALFTTLIGFIANVIVLSGWHWMVHHEDDVDTFEFWRLSINLWVLPFDCMINILCLHLQFPFANNVYLKYCGYCAKYWKLIMVKKTERSLMKKFMEYEGQRSSKDEPDEDMVCSRSSITKEICTEIIQMESNDDITKFKTVCFMIN